MRLAVQLLRPLSFQGFWVTLQSRMFASGKPATSKKAAAKGKTIKAPQKHRLLLRKKAMVTAARQGVVDRDRATPFTTALFGANSSKDRTTNLDGHGALSVSSDELARRAMIARGWSRLQMLRLHAQCSHEHAFMHGKIKAMEELQRVSERLALWAEIPEYEPMPVGRRLPSLTPPNELPFA